VLTNWLFRGAIFIKLTGPQLTITSAYLWNLKLHYRIHKIPLLVRVLSDINPVHALQLHFLNTHFNIQLPHTFIYFMWPLFMRFPNCNTLCIPFNPHSCHKPCRSSVIWAFKQYLETTHDKFSQLSCCFTQTVADLNRVHFDNDQQKTKGATCAHIQWSWRHPTLGHDRTNYQSESSTTHALRSATADFFWNCINP
jgi:hypothetical protein